MLDVVLRTEAFYFSYSYDLTHTFQRLQMSPSDFYSTTFIERADQRFVWNRYLVNSFLANKSIAKYALPIIHGCKLTSKKNQNPIILYSELVIAITTLNINEHSFTYGVVSRRSTHRAGTRYEIQNFLCK